MRLLEKSQAIVMMGETGSGKTESTKHILRYLCYFTRSGIDIKMTEANTIMEAFGNARTTCNNNSSRYSKFVQVFSDVLNTLLSLKMEIIFTLAPL